MNVYAGIAACFHTVKTFSNFELNYVRLIWPFNANACFAFIKCSHTVFLIMLERSTDVVWQRNGNLFMMKTVGVQVPLLCRNYSLLHPPPNSYSFFQSVCIEMWLFYSVISLEYTFHTQSSKRVPVPNVLTLSRVC